MFVACSSFAPSGERPAAVYNRATLELILSVLFNNTIVIPISTFMDSPPFYQVFGRFAKARWDLRALDVNPIRLSVDPERHFNPGMYESRRGILQRAHEAYLCGRAHTRRDVWSEDPSELARMKLKFGSVGPDVLDQIGFTHVIDRLRHQDPDILENFSVYVRDHYRAINHYFQTSNSSLTQTTDYFRTQSYWDRAKPAIKRFAQELDSIKPKQDYASTFNEIFIEAEANKSTNMNQLADIGRRHFGELIWNKEIQPFINTHRWVLDGKLCGAIYNRNIEMWGSDISEVDSLIATLNEYEPSATVDIVTACNSGDERVGFDSWEAVIEIRKGRGNEFLLKIQNESENHIRRALIYQYLEYCGKQLAPVVRLTDLEGSTHSWALSSGTGWTHYLIENLSIIAGGALGVVAGLGSGYAVFNYSPLAGIPAAAITAQAVGGGVKRAVERHADAHIKKMVRNIEIKARTTANAQLLHRYSANLLM